MIKGLVTVSTGSDVQLLVGGEMPEVGQYYYLESATEGTGAQNRAFHALTMEYWKSGQHSYNADNYNDFRNQIKRTLGAGFECFIYVLLHSGSPKIYDAKTIDDIPEEVRTDPDMKDTVRGRLKSWSDYTKKQRTSTIDNLISEMLQAGINSKKFEEILKGMEK